MATYFHKFKGLKANMRHTNLTDKYIERMIVRKQVSKPDNMHPDVKERWNTMTQAPLPLKFKLHPLPTPDTTFVKALGIMEELPFTVSSYCTLIIACRSRGPTTVMCQYTLITELVVCAR